MKVLLVGSNFCVAPYAVYPLGLSVVARIAEDAGHIVRQFDPLANSANGNDWREPLRQAISDFIPDVIGCSIRNLDNIDSRKLDCKLLGKAFEVIAELRRAGKPVILGGPGFSLYPDAILEITQCDYGIVGDAEDVLPALLEKLEKGHPVPERVQARRQCQHISGALYDSKIGDFYYNEVHTIPVQTKRGCPFQCAYCTYPALEGHQLRLRPLEEVVADLRTIKEKYPDVLIYFTDSIFNDPAKEYMPLVKRMIDEKLDISWTAFISPAGLNADEIELMAESGLVNADLGVDATTDATLRGLNKGFCFADVKGACARLQEHKVGITINAIFGGPNETYDSIRQGIANLRALEPAYSIVFSGIRILDGAPLFARAKREGKVPEGWNGIRPIYYFAPGLEAEIVHEMLLDGFKGSQYCVYPGNSRDKDIRKIHKYGFVKLRKMQLGN